MTDHVHLRLVLQQEGPYAFRIDFAGTDLAALHSDEPPPLGEGRGPNPSALLLASIANCLSASLLFALRKYRNEPGPLRTEIVATPTRNSDGRLRILRAYVTLQLAEGNEHYTQLERILTQFENYCTVTQSVRDGIEVEVTVKDAHGRTLLGDKSYEAGA